jgi:hypothetical protein
MNVSFTYTIFLHSLHQLVRPYASVEQVHVFIAGTSSCPAWVATSLLFQLRCHHLQSEFCTSWRFNSLSPPPNNAPIDCTTPIHCTHMFMDVHHTFVFVNQEFNYSSLLETGICKRRHFKNSIQLRNLPEWLVTRYARGGNIRFQAFKTALFYLC